MPTPELLARQLIDQKLTAAGWIVQDFKVLNLGAGAGVAVREFQTASGPADYVLFVDRKAVGVVEAKSEGTTLRRVFEQSARYMANFPEQEIVESLQSALTQFENIAEDLGEE